MIDATNFKAFVFRLLGAKLAKRHNPNLSKKDANNVVAYLSTNNIKDIVLNCDCCTSHKQIDLSLVKVYSRYASKGRFCHVIMEGYTGAQFFTDIIDASRAWFSIQGSRFNLAEVLKITPQSNTYKISRTTLVS